MNKTIAFAHSKSPQIKNGVSAATHGGKALGNARIETLFSGLAPESSPISCLQVNQLLQIPIPKDLLPQYPEVQLPDLVSIDQFLRHLADKLPTTPFMAACKALQDTLKTGKLVESLLSHPNSVDLQRLYSEFTSKHPGNCIVRSSSPEEDTHSGKTGAGEFESIPDIRDIRGFFDGMLKSIASNLDPTILADSLPGLEPQAEFPRPYAMILQRMVNLETFMVIQSTPTPNEVTISVIYGRGDQLMSSKANGTTYKVNLETGSFTQLSTPSGTDHSELDSETKRIALDLCIKARQLATQNKVSDFQSEAGISNHSPVMVQWRPLKASPHFAFEEIPAEAKQAPIQGEGLVFGCAKGPLWDARDRSTAEVIEKLNSSPTPPILCLNSYDQTLDGLLHKGKIAGISVKIGTLGDHCSTQCAEAKVPLFRITSAQANLSLAPDAEVTLVSSIVNTPPSLFGAILEGDHMTQLRNAQSSSDRSILDHLTLTERTLDQLNTALQPLVTQAIRSSLTPEDGLLLISTLTKLNHSLISFVGANMTTAPKDREARIFHKAMRTFIQATKNLSPKSEAPYFEAIMKKAKILLNDKSKTFSDLNSPLQNVIASVHRLFLINTLKLCCTQRSVSSDTGFPLTLSPGTPTDGPFPANFFRSNQGISGLYEDKVYGLVTSNTQLFVLQNTRVLVSQLGLHSATIIEVPQDPAHPHSPGRLEGQFALNDPKDYSDFTPYSTESRQSTHQYVRAYAFALLLKDAIPEIQFRFASTSGTLHFCTTANIPRDQLHQKFNAVAERLQLFMMDTDTVDSAHYKLHLPENFEAEIQALNSPNPRIHELDEALQTTTQFLLEMLQRDPLALRMSTFPGNLYYMLGYAQFVIEARTGLNVHNYDSLVLALPELLPTEKALGWVSAMISQRLLTKDQAFVLLMLKIGDMSLSKESGRPSIKRVAVTDGFLRNDIDTFFEVLYSSMSILEGHPDQTQISLQLAIHCLTSGIENQSDRIEKDMGDTLKFIQKECNDKNLPLPIRKFLISVFSHSFDCSNKRNAEEFFTRVLPELLASAISEADLNAHLTQFTPPIAFTSEWIKFLTEWKRPAHGILPLLTHPIFDYKQVESLQDSIQTLEQFGLNRGTPAFSPQDAKLAVQGNAYLRRESDAFPVHISILAQLFPDLAHTLHPVTQLSTENQFEFSKLLCNALKLRNVDSLQEISDMVSVFMTLTPQEKQIVSHCYSTATEYAPLPTLVKVIRWCQQNNRPLPKKWIEGRDPRLFKILGWGIEAAELIPNGKAKEQLEENITSLIRVTQRLSSDLEKQGSTIGADDLEFSDFAIELAAKILKASVRGKPMADGSRPQFNFTDDETRKRLSHKTIVSLMEDNPDSPLPSTRFEYFREIFIVRNQESPKTEDDKSPGTAAAAAAARP